MSRLRNSLKGLYIPSFFEMSIDTNDDEMIITNLSNKDRTTLFHEYIHFLQDFTTYYGLNALYVHSEYLHSVANRVYNLKSQEIPIPFEIKDNEDNVLLNQQICNLTLGDGNACPIFDVTDIKIENNQLIYNQSKESIQSITLNPKGSNIASFGALSIMESMAYIMERCCSPDGYVKSPDFPYSAAEKVADYYVPGFSKNLFMILALCDMSLQCSNPGVCFVRVMEKISNGDLHFKEAEAIYDYFYNQQYEVIAIGKCSFIDVFKRFIKIVQSQLKSYLKDMSIAESYYAWIDQLVDFAIKWREDDRYFLLRMARCKNLASNKYWGKVIAHVGTPLMKNNLHHYFHRPPQGFKENDAVVFFKALYEIEKLFLEGSSKCSMYEWCKNSPLSTPNELCNSFPWRKVSEEKLCPYALIWKHWGLCGYEPKIKTTN